MSRLLSEAVSWSDHGGCRGLVGGGEGWPFPLVECNLVLRSRLFFSASLNGPPLPPFHPAPQEVYLIPEKLYQSQPASQPHPSLPQAIWTLLTFSPSPSSRPGLRSPRGKSGRSASPRLREQTHPLSLPACASCCCLTLTSFQSGCLALES